MNDKLNQYRVFPRLFAIFYLLLTLQVVDWFMELSSPSNAQAGMVSAIVAAAAAFFKFYVETGNAIPKKG